jgi:hypothetical protein
MNGKPYGLLVDQLKMTPISFLRPPHPKNQFFIGFKPAGFQTGIYSINSSGFQVFRLGVELQLANSSWASFS